MTFVLRPYQREALDALHAYWDANGGNPLTVLATGTGKSALIGALLREIYEKYPPLRALVLTHVQELVSQNVTEMTRIWPAAPGGVNCAALGSRDVDSQILFATIHSVFRNPQALGQRHLVIIDEAHMVPRDDDSMYLKLIADLRDITPTLRVWGLTATDYRLDSGRLTEGENRIFHDVVYEYGIAQGIRDKWLCPLSSKAMKAQIDVSLVGRRGGEFIESELQNAADRGPLVNAACDEIVLQGNDRKSWLIFCCGIKHATHVRDALRERGINAEAVFGETEQIERERIVKGFVAGEIRALVNVGVLTTGFNATGVDLLVMLRPTLSTGLYVQMVGRGTRKSDGKTDCRILDFAGNVQRHGPVDSVNPNCKPGSKSEGARAWECPGCAELNALDIYVCGCCGYQRPHKERKPKHATVADAVPILATAKEWVDVDSMHFSLHRKRSDPFGTPTLRVSYQCGLISYDEWICLEHTGYARTKAEKWWLAHGGSVPIPMTVMAALERRDEIAWPSAITVFRDGNWWRIGDRRSTNSDGVAIDIDQYFNAWIRNSREMAAEALRNTPMNDSVPY